MTQIPSLKGRRLLIVEDEFFLADDLAKALRGAGAEILGPIASVDDALDLLDETERLDGAVLDLNLRGEMAYPVADAMIERGIPFVFVTGYDATQIPLRYRGVTRCEKPVHAFQVVTALFG